MKHGSLFSGIGGFDLAAESVGWENIFSVEKDLYCNFVLKKNFPKTKRYFDIRKFTIDKSANALYSNFTFEQWEIFDMAAKRKEYDGAVKMYESGLSIADCADYFKISRQAMWMVLKRRNVSFRDNKIYGEDNHFFRGSSDDDYAQNVVEKAVKKGILIPLPCEVCGESKKMSDGRRDVQAHHPDYNFPLNVIWLCQKHHFEWHKNNNAIPRKEVMPDEVSRTIDVVSGGFP